MNKTCRLPMPLYSLSNVIHLMIYTAVEILNNQEIIYLEKKMELVTWNWYSILLKWLGLSVISLLEYLGCNVFREVWYNVSKCKSESKQTCHNELKLLKTPHIYEQPIRKSQECSLCSWPSDVSFCLCSFTVHSRPTEINLKDPFQLYLATTLKL